jgi:hypothetical protein
VTPALASNSARTEAGLEHSPAEVEFTILMPCLNEAETIGACVRKAMGFLSANSIVGEILVADNGSTDGSVEISSNLGARVVHASRKGYGAALQAGIAAARGRYIIMGDADDSYDFSDLSAFVSALREGAQLVMGNRFKGGIAKGAMPFLHRFVGNPALSGLGQLLFNVNTGDFHCGLRGFDAAAIRQLTLVTTGMEFASEMVVRAALAGFKIREVPTTLRPDGRTRAPHIRTWRDGWRHLKFLLMFCPKWLFAVPGLLLMALGLLLAGVLWVGPLPLAPGLELSANAFVAACFMVIAGVQLLTFGVLARYYGAITGMLPSGVRSDWMVKSMTTDGVVRVAGVLLLGGLLLFGFALARWAEVGFGALTSPHIPRMVEVGLSLVVISLQLGFGAFMIGILQIPLVRREH